MFFLRSSQRIIAALLVVAALRAHGAQAVADKTAAAVIVAEADKALERCRDTTYQHKTDVDETAGRYRLDCSAFLTLVLKKAAPDAVKAVASTGKTHPLAADYYDTIAAARGGDAWRKIHVADAQPGDVLAWRKAERVAGDTTGHVMIIDKAPEKDGALWKVTVVDSTSKPHGNDTRAEGQTGLGRGTIWIKVDEQGDAAGYYQAAPEGTLNKTALLVGRVASK